MPGIFLTAASTGETEALVIHCSSARMQQQFHAFLTGGLGLRKYCLVAVPGGVQALTLLDYLPKFSWAGWRWVKFLVDLEKPARVILIGHDECAWYRDLRFWSRPRSSRERIIDDLRQTARQVRERYQQARVDCYFASIAGAEAVFEPV